MFEPSDYIFPQNEAEYTAIYASGATIMGVALAVLVIIALVTFFWRSDNQYGYRNRYPNR